MWKIQPTDQFLRDQAWYAKKRRAELAAVLNNLQRFVDLLVNVPNSRAVQAGFLHTEGKGILAVDERAGGGNLEATRLYVFADDSTEVIHLITIGNKAEQEEDVKLCHAFLAKHVHHHV